jgi:hypothetical protein
MASLEMAGPENRLPQNLVVMKPCDFRAAAHFLHAITEGKING